MASSEAKAAAGNSNTSAEKQESTGVHQAENITTSSKRHDEQMHESLAHQQNSHIVYNSSHAHVHQESGMDRQEESSPTQTSIVKHSLLQFALQHFRNE